ncbi:MAG: prolyl oligopeptidase family serine peptidase [Verrucomicrobiaceae bacterium]|nr:prolyl oligopeptidase family serine peptidase [Verrucomicrobiaceae bacterium]
MNSTLLSTLVFVLVASFAAAQSKSAKLDLILDKDANKDGRITKEELGEKYWARASGFDANGDGALDAKELEALTGKGKRGKGEEPRPGGANASFELRDFKGTNGQTIRYSLFVPKEKPASLPLVLCLHGAGGSTTAANILAAPEMQGKHPCIVMAPGCDGKQARWAKSEFRSGADARSVMPELMEALDAVIAETKADKSRLYITGQSMGGMGTWGTIAEHAAKFAAAVPVCGIWQPADAPKMNGVAIWAFHGGNDKTVPVTGSRDMIDALKKAGVKPEPKYTEFPGVGHASWGPAYEKAELWDWLFSQRKAVK